MLEAATIAVTAVATALIIMAVMVVVLGLLQKFSARVEGKNNGTNVKA